MGAASYESLRARFGCSEFRPTATPCQSLHRGGSSRRPFTAIILRIKAIPGSLQISVSRLSLACCASLSAFPTNGLSCSLLTSFDGGLSPLERALAVFCLDCCCSFLSLPSFTSNFSAIRSSCCAWSSATSYSSHVFGRKFPLLSSRTA